MEEIWKDVIGYEGLYQISNLGRVKSIRYPKEIIKIGNKLKRGAQHIQFCVNYIHKNIYIHRLVAIHFIPNPDNLPFVLHKKEDLDENGCLYNGEDNLWWGTAKDNSQDMISKGRDRFLFKTNHPRTSLGKKGYKSDLAIKVNQYTLNGEFIREWGSMVDAGNELKVNKGGICCCCKGKQKTAGGFIWKYL